MQPSPPFTLRILFILHNWSSLLTKSLPLLLPAPDSLHSTFCLYDFDVCRYLESGLIQDLSFCDWLISSGIISLGFIHAVPCDRIFFLFKANIPLYVYIIFSHPLICLSMDMLVCFICCDYCCYEYECACISEIVLPVLLYVYPKVGLLYDMIILFLIFLGTAILFSTVAISFYVPISSKQRGPVFF